MGRVKDFYDSNFEKLSEDKKFHYATRNQDFSYLKNHQPTETIAEILKNNDYSKVNCFEARKQYFEKYDHLFAIEAALVRVNHILNLYGEDLREDFKKEIALEKLYNLVDQMASDDDAIKTLSTYAINVIALSETLFPRGKNYLKQIAEKSLDYKGDPILLAYLYTHIIICATDFYYHDIAIENLAIMQKVLDKAEKIISENYEDITMDLKLEFLVCANLLNSNKTNLRTKIKQECDQILENNLYVVDSKKPERFNTIDGAEHRNILYIMSGLDH